MDAPVVAALISAVSALALAAWNTRQKRRNQKDQETAGKELETLKNQLARETKAEDRRTDAHEQLTRYRLPLLDAASDLGSRIDNILHEGFLAYLSADDPRRETALLSTVYRIARYFGTLEILYGRVNHLRFER